MLTFPNAIFRFPLWIILLVVLGGFTPGCVSLPTFSELKELPGFQSGPVGKEDVVYDPGIRAYRIKVSKDSSGELTGIVLRDSVEKKIHTENELARAIETIKRESVGGGTKGAAYGLTAVYTPVTFIESIIGYTVGAPMFWIVYNFKEKNARGAEAAYISGRRHFDSHEYETALAEWERAIGLMSSLHLLSDIDYWRGRAFEAHGEVDSARTAYLTFLNYSERSIPSDFKNLYPNDPTWAEKADDAEKRVYGIKAGL